MEVALGSAEIRKSGGQDSWRIAFKLNLVTAGLKVKDGTLPPKVLQVVIEPPAERAKNKGSD
jgi:hypothetical protein